MKSSTILICPKCNREYNIFLGNGMTSFCKEQLFDYTNKEGNIITRSKNNQILNLPELHEFLKLENLKINNNFGNDYYYCDKCKSYEIKFYYYLRIDNRIFRPKYKCERCESTLNHIPKKELDYNHYCSKCNIPMKNTNYIVYWD